MRVGVAFTGFEKLIQLSNPSLILPLKKGEDMINSIVLIFVYSLGI